jgi:hypothetical protein
MGSPTLHNLYELELEKKTQAMKWEANDEIARLTLSAQPPAFIVKPMDSASAPQWDPID